MTLEQNYKMHTICGLAIMLFGMFVASMLYLSGKYELGVFFWISVFVAVLGFVEMLYSWAMRWWHESTFK